MNLTDSVILAFVDKLLIGALILVVGYWLNKRLERVKGQISLQGAVVPDRQRAYRSLWTLTAPLSPRGPLNLPDTIRNDIYEKLRVWYYGEGNAMYLSLDAADHFLRGLDVLDSSADLKTVKNTFSNLRTQMKVDLGVYTPNDASVTIPRVRKLSQQQ